MSFLKPSVLTRRNFSSTLGESIVLNLHSKFAKQCWYWAFSRVLSFLSFLISTVILVWLYCLLMIVPKLAEYTYSDNFLFLLLDWVAYDLTLLPFPLLFVSSYWNSVHYTQVDKSFVFGSACCVLFFAPSISTKHWQRFKRVHSPDFVYHFLIVHRNILAIYMTLSNCALFFRPAWFQWI